MTKWKVRTLPTMYGKRYIVCRYEGEPPDIHHIQLSNIYGDKQQAQQHDDELNKK